MRDRSPIMRRSDVNKSLKVAFVLALCLTASLQRGASAQQVQVGENVNVLPVSKAPPAIRADDYLRGRSLRAAAERAGHRGLVVNQDHALAIYNDFRAVDVPDEPAFPISTREPWPRLWSGARTACSRAYWAGPAPRPNPATAGGGASKPGSACRCPTTAASRGPGASCPALPFDDSPASLASPARLEGMSDPVLVERPVRQVLRVLPGLHPRWREQAMLGRGSRTSTTTSCATPSSSSA